MKYESKLKRALRKMFKALPYRLWVEDVGTFVNRLPTILPGFGSPIQNDALMLTQTVSLPAATATTTTLNNIAPTFSKGFVRVKVFGGATANATLTSILVVVTDGTTFVPVGHYAPQAVLTLSISAATGSPYVNGGTLGTNYGGVDMLFPFEVDINCNQVSVVVTIAVATATAKLDLEISGTV